MKELKGRPPGLAVGRPAAPGLRELTIEVGGSDIYVNLSRFIEVDPAHKLYEAILTDSEGSRAIYIDREDLLDCLNDAFLKQPPAMAKPPDRPVDQEA